MKRSVGSRGRSWVLGLCLTANLAGCSALEPPVARSVSGVVTEGRFIEPDAYALYAAGAVREARSQWPQALALYERALEVDDRGPEIRTRIAAVACRLKQYKLADQAFSAANRSGADYAPLWFELARCRKTRGDLGTALSAALEAVRLDPERHEASLLAADLADARGDHELGWRLRDGLATFASGSRVVQRALLQLARERGDQARAKRAQTALAALSVDEPETITHRSVQALEALGRGELAVARQQAEQQLAADPSDADALVVALLAADLAQDETAFAQLLTRTSEGGLALSPASEPLLSALISRRVGPEAAALLPARH